MILCVFDQAVGHKHSEVARSHCLGRLALAYYGVFLHTGCVLRTVGHKHSEVARSHCLGRLALAYYGVFLHTGCALVCFVYGGP